MTKTRLYSPNSRLNSDSEPAVSGSFRTCVAFVLAVLATAPAKGTVPGELAKRAADNKARAAACFDTQPCSFLENRVASQVSTVEYFRNLPPEGPLVVQKMAAENRVAMETQQLEGLRRELQQCREEHKDDESNADKALANLTCDQLSGLHCTRASIEARRLTCHQAAVAAEEAARKQKEAEEHQRLEARRRIQNDPRAMVPIYSATICTFEEARAAILKEIATEKKYAKISGQVDRSRLIDLGWQLRKADDVMAQLKSDLRREWKVAPQSCSGKTVKRALECLDVEETLSVSEWTSGRLADEDCADGIALQARTVRSLERIPDDE